ncbi:MAG: toll/interleukin-1 receptor domain-containing protein [Saprospiraceae bacterium]|nr:toll/interleukin-1 receptor domain-containing protein [Saprospiraceae bacterium]
MCEYLFQHLTDPKAKPCCTIGNYFSYWPQLKSSLSQAPIEWSSEIPMDSNGHCLFHSRDIAWKIKNHFYSRFLQLLKIMERLPVEIAGMEEERRIDLRECCFIGNPGDGHQRGVIALEDLQLFGPLELDFQYSIFEDALYFRKAHLGQTQVNLGYCQLKGIYRIYESKLGGLNLNHAHLSGGLLINHSSFYGTVFTDYLKAKGIFELSSNAFFQAASLQNIFLQTHFVHVTANRFYATVNFNNSRILADTYFLNNQFDQDILFLEVDFQKAFSFSDNTVEGMSPPKSNSPAPHKQPTQVAKQAYSHSIFSSNGQLNNASQFEVITHKINAISKRIRNTKSKTTDRERQEGAPIAPQHLTDLPHPYHPDEEAVAGLDKPTYMENEREEFHAFLSFSEEDAETAQALHKALTQRGLKVWFSKVHLRTGDSIINTINQAINNSRSGIVLISPNTFNDTRHFPILELNSLLTRDLYHNKPFFPVYHEITPEQVAEQLILIGDRLATDTTKGIDVVAKRLFDVLKNHQII